MEMKALRVITITTATLSAALHRARDIRRKADEWLRVFAAHTEDHGGALWGTGCCEHHTRAMNRTRSNAILSAFECVLSRRIKSGVPFAPPLPVAVACVSQVAPPWNMDRSVAAAQHGI